MQKTPLRVRFLSGVRSPCFRSSSVRAIPLLSVLSEFARNIAAAKSAADRTIGGATCKKSLPHFLRKTFPF